MKQIKNIDTYDLEYKVKSRDSNHVISPMAEDNP